jgi:hypothetical protein
VSLNFLFMARGCMVKSFGVNQHHHANAMEEQLRGKEKVGFDEKIKCTFLYKDTNPLLFFEIIKSCWLNLIVFALCKKDNLW